MLRIKSVLTDRTSVSVMFQNVFQKWTSRFWVIRSNSAPLNSGSMAYFPEVKKELAATPGEEGNHCTVITIVERIKKRKIEVRGSENWNRRVKTDNNTKVTGSKHFTNTSKLLIGFYVLTEIKTSKHYKSTVQLKY